MNGPMPPRRAPRVHRASRAAATLALMFSLVPGLLAASTGPEDRVLAPIPVPVLRTGFPVAASTAAFSYPPVMVDLDFDGRSELIAIDDDGKIFVVRNDGARHGAFPKNFGVAPSGPIAVGDIDGDGYLELVAVGINGRVRIFSDEGAVEADLADLPWAPVGGAVLTEFDTSGKLAILVVTADGTFHALRGEGGEFPGWPVNGSAVAASPPFAYIGPDNFPRVGYLGAAPDRARIFFTYGDLDTVASYTPASPFSAARPVAGLRAMSLGFPDAEHLYSFTMSGKLTRLDPDLLNGATEITPLAQLPDDSVFVQPAMLDANGDLVPELAVLSVRGDTTQVWLLDGASGNPLAGFPRRYLEAQPVGGIVCADVGDNNAAEMIFNRGGSRISCVRTNGTEAWTLNGLPAVAGPALGDLDGDGGPDLAVVTTTGDIYAYSLGLSGTGPRAMEWTNAGGSPRHEGRHQLRDRAVIHSFWPPPITPADAFVTRPVMGVFDDDGRPDVLWSDYLTGKTWGFATGAGPMPGMPQTYGRGAVLDAPAVGDVTGDGIYESVQGTATGYLVWGNRTGTTDFMLIDNGRQLSPPSLADLNADGVLDVIVGSSTGRLYAANLKTKTLLPGFPVTTTGAIVLPAALGDVNGDGQTDIVVVGGPRTIYAYPRTGATALAGWPRQFPSGHTLGQPILVPIAGQAALCVAFARTTGIDSVTASVVGASGAPLPGWPRRLFNALNILSGPVAGPFDNDATVDLAFATGGDTVIVFNAIGNRLLTKALPTPGSIELAAMVDLDLDLRPDIVVVSDESVLIGLRYDGLSVRSFTRLQFGFEAGATPAFGDLGNDGILDMAISDLGFPLVYSWGSGSWNADSAPWPMKGHDRYRTHAYSGPTVVGVDGPGAAGPPARGTGTVRAVPNPTQGAIAFAHTRALAGAYEAAIFDVRGRRVRTLAAGTLPVGGEAVTWTWDGRDEAGHEVHAGIYFYRVRDAVGTLGEKVVRLR